ncbi:hypothetical protein BH10BAC2_BH10BAC2_15810 [soil metagenome]
MKKSLHKTLLVLHFLLSGFLIYAQTGNKPNVLFIAVDDLSIGFGTYGNPEAPTPNVTRLMQHGTMFKQVYVQYALCNPSRTSILSGKRPNSTGVLSNATSMRVKLGSNYKFLPEYFDSYGYYTGKFGKMTCGHDYEVAWDYIDSTVPGDGTKDIGGEVHWWVDTIHKTPMETKYGQYLTGLLSKMREPHSAPYFYGFGLATHNEFDPPIESWNKIGDPGVQELLPVDINSTLGVYANGSGNITLPNTPINDGDDIPLPALKGLTPYQTDEWKRIRHAYYGEIVSMDDLLGVLLDEMDRTDAWQNTIVVFFSDHGIQTGEHNGLWFKQTLFEGCLRIPMVICAPGKPGGGIHNSPVEAVDIYSTLSELAGLPVPADQEGSSLVPLLERPNINWKKAAFAQVRRVDRTGSSDTTLYNSVRTTNYHYNNWDTSGEELYDIVIDPDEFTNQINNIAYAKILDSMRTLFAGNWQGALPPKYQKKTFYKDADGDNFGIRSDSVIAYFAPLGYVKASGDCDDTKSYVYPGAKERSCNGIDDNCDGVIDENKVLPTIATPEGLDICANGYVTLQASGGAGAVYQWKKNGVNITSATKKTFKAKSVGAYSVEVTNPGTGCIAESLPTAIISSCSLVVMNNEALSTNPTAKFSLYPNPSTGNIVVTYKSSNIGKIAFNVYDVMGRLVYSMREQALKTSSSYNLNLAKLNAGVYYLEVNDSNVKQRIKFIIER